MQTTDLAIIGAGLMGAGAARHAARMGADVTLIGPGEPSNWKMHTGVYASHYDAARITRRNATHPFWAKVSRAAIDRYRALEAETGIDFFAPVGALMAGPTQGLNKGFIARASDTASRLDIPCETLSGPALSNRFPYLRFPEGTKALYETSDAGWINPRAYAKAAIKSACQNGATHIAEEVTRITRNAADFTIETQTTRLLAKRVVIACGAFSNAAGLLPAPLPLKTFARTVAFFELSEEEGARLADMPSIVFRAAVGEAEPYILPPVRYPDGKLYIKIGGDPKDRLADSVGAMKAWFKTDGDAEAGAYMAGLLRDLMPDLQAETVTHGPCVVTFTDTGLPYIRQVEAELFALTGGNGAGAKCADELGRIGAEFALSNGAHSDALADWID